MTEPVPDPSNARGRATRERIERAADLVFAEQGLELTLDQVAQAAATTRMTVHRHTGGREALLTRLVLAEAAALGRELRQVLDGAGPLDERLVDALTLAVVDIRQRPNLLPLFTRANPAGAWPAIDPDDHVLGSVWSFWRRYLADPGPGFALRAGVEETVGWLLNQVLLLLMVPDNAPDPAAVRRTFATFVVPAALVAVDGH